MWKVVRSPKPTVYIKTAIQKRPSGPQEELPGTGVTVWLCCVHVSLELDPRKADPNFKLLKPIVVQSLSHVPLFATPWTAAHQASLSVSLLELAQIHIQ